MQAVSSKFHELAQGGIRPHKWEVLMSFNKEFDDTRSFFVLNSSQLDGPDVLQPIEDNPIQYWDYYEYVAYRSRLQSLSWSSRLDFPHSVRYSVADVTLNNYDNYFTPGTNSPLAPYILPGRPIKILAGYGAEPILQQFVGITQGKPVLDKEAKSASFHALDFISEIAALRFASTVALSNVRTDEALVAIFDQFGISPSSYALSRGRNVIPFLFLETDGSVGDALNKIMQAEGGELYLDEQGLIRFTDRLAISPTPVFTFNESNVASFKHSDETRIINRVVIKSAIRQVQAMQPIFSGAGITESAALINNVTVPASGTATYEIPLDNPAVSVDTPTNGFSTASSWFTAEKADGSGVPSGLTVSDVAITATKLTLTFSNTNAYAVYVNALEVWAEPAKVVDTIIFEAKDQSSIDSYGEYVYSIENDLFGNEENCESFAYTIINAYAQPGTILDMKVKGDYALQLGDIVWVDVADVTGSFKIIGKSFNIIGRGIEESIKLKRSNPENWFVLGQSQLDGADELAP